MPSGIPTATFATSEAGATKAALFSVRILAANDATLAERLERRRRSMAEVALAADAPARSAAHDLTAAASSRR